MRIAMAFILFLMGIGQIFAGHSQCPKVDVLIDGMQIAKYYHQGSTYVEAIKGREYSIRISNPLGERVAVALSVDGLNTINAQHTQARLGPKWVLGPYESIIIDGWQINSQQARRFFFTNEARSYGARLGQTENLGLISAAFFKERPRVIQHMDKPFSSAVPLQGNATEKSKDQAPAARLESQREDRAASRELQPEYAATGIGDRVNHEVERVYLDLEDRPFATFDLRYEFRPILVKLGVIPPTVALDPLLRRERAKGFREDGYCPEP